MSPEDLTPPRPARRTIALLLVLLGIALLVINALTTTFWDDETNGFYLARMPFATLMKCFYHNVHEDPPLFIAMVSPVVKMAGYNGRALRIIPIIFWIACAAGVFQCAKRIGGARAAWTSTVVLLLMPSHWMLPASFRWYSLFAALIVWNFHFFLALLEASNSPTAAAPSVRRPLVGYVGTGVLAWYTIYVAPVFFLGHLLIALTSSRRRVALTKWLIIGWIGITILFAPWLMTLYRQLHESVAQTRLVGVILCAYTLVAGEMSLPYNLWFLVPTLLVALGATIMLLFSWRSARQPAILALLGFASLAITGTIHPKRQLIFSPFVAIALGMAIVQAMQSRSRAFRGVSLATFFAALFLIAGSAVNLVRRDGWLTYRWIEPFSQVARQARQQTPGALLLVNGNGALYELAGPHGYEERLLLDRGDIKIGNDIPVYAPEQFFFPPHQVDAPLLEQRLRSVNHVVYLHHNAAHLFSGCRPPLDKFMQQHGFAPRSTQTMTPAAPAFMRHHPIYAKSSIAPTDKFRFVWVVYERTQAQE